MGYDMGYYEYDNYGNRYDNRYESSKIVTWHDGRVVDCWDGNCRNCRLFEDCNMTDRHGLYMRYDYDLFEDTYAYADGPKKTALQHEEVKTKNSLERKTEA